MTTPQSTIRVGSESFYQYNVSKQCYIVIHNSDNMFSLSEPRTSLFHLHLEKKAPLNTNFNNARSRINLVWIHLKYLLSVRVIQ